MLRRFNFAFTLLDEARCNALVGLDSVEESVDYIDDFVDADFKGDGKENFEQQADISNPFETAQLVICSLDFLTKNNYRYEQAVAAEWDLLLVDEPTGNLDSKNGDAVMQMLQKLHQQGTTIVMVTHDHRYSRCASRQIQLLDGQIIASGQKLEVA